MFIVQFHEFVSFISYTCGRIRRKPTCMRKSFERHKFRCKSKLMFCVESLEYSLSKANFARTLEYLYGRIVW